MTELERTPAYGVTEASAYLRLPLQERDDAGIAIPCHHQHFAPGTPDEQWLPVMGERGWILLTVDKRIRHRHLEKREVGRNGVRMFCFTSNFKPALMEAALTRAIPRMRLLVECQPAPWVATISEGGINLLDTFGSAKLYVSR